MRALAYTFPFLPFPSSRWAQSSFTPRRPESPGTPESHFPRDGIVKFIFHSRLSLSLFLFPPHCGSSSLLRNSPRRTEGQSDLDDFRAKFYDATRPRATVVTYLSRRARGTRGPFLELEAARGQTLFFRLSSKFRVPSSTSIRIERNSAPREREMIKRNAEKATVRAELVNRTSVILSNGLSTCFHSHDF